MEKDQINSLRLLSTLLQYPDRPLLSQINNIEAVVKDISSKELKNCIDEFLNYLKSNSPIQIQECYTAAFDMNPATTLNLTYHIFGDNEKRAAVLAQLQQIYLDAGYERTTGELPDYLPMMLEFLSVCQHKEDFELIWECIHRVEAVIDRLQQTAPPYATLLKPLIQMAANHL